MNDKAASKKWDDENYSIQVDCPAHLTHKATLFIYGHPEAGLWRCQVPLLNVDIWDNCPHYDTEQEVTEDYEGAPDKISVCVLCRVAVEEATV